MHSFSYLQILLFCEQRITYDVIHVSQHVYDDDRLSGECAGKKHIPPYNFHYLKITFCQIRREITAQ